MYLNNLREQLRKNLSSITLKEKILGSESTTRRRVRVNNSHDGALLLGLLGIPGRGPHHGSGADDKHDIDGTPLGDPLVRPSEQDRVQLLAEPDHAGPEEAPLAVRAVRQLLGVDLGDGDGWVQER